MQLGDKKNVPVRLVTPEDTNELSAVVARAFEDDPIYAWIFPDESRRLSKMITINEALFPRMLRVTFFEFTTTTELTGLAIWAGPEKFDPPTMAMLGAVPKLLRTAGFGGVSKFGSLMSTLKKNHPKEPHWYLAGLATDPPKQRTGVGSALVVPKLEVCDREHLPAYLETQKAENVPYYERFGFRVTKEIDLPKEGPHIWLMWRDPQ